jgi:hypothetical protein
MAALNFPSSPSVGQEYAAPNGVTYTWDGEAWTLTGGPQYLLLGGRTGTTNDPILSTTTDGTLTGSLASGADLYAKSTSHATKGALRWDDTQIWWESMPSFLADTSDTKRNVRINPTITSAPNAGSVVHKWSVIDIDPVLTISDTGAFNLGLDFAMIRFTPTVTINGANPGVAGIKAAGTFTNTVNPILGSFPLFSASPSFVSATPNVSPIPPVMFFSTAAMNYAAASGTASLPITFGAYTLADWNTVKASVSGGTFNVGDYSSFASRPTFEEATGATLTITYRKGFKHAAYVETSGAGFTSPTVTNDSAVYIENGPPALTNQYALGFNAAAATHKALSAHTGAGSPTLGTGNAPVTGDPDAWIRVDINGTLGRIPVWF